MLLAPTEQRRLSKEGIFYLHQLVFKWKYEASKLHRTLPGARGHLKKGVEIMCQVLCFCFKHSMFLCQETLFKKSVLINMQSHFKRQILLVKV